MPTLREIQDLNKRLDIKNRRLTTTNKNLGIKFTNLQKENKDITTKLKTKEKELSSETLLRKNLFVKKIVNNEKKRSDFLLDKKNLELGKLKADLLRLRADYAHLDTIRPVQKAEFNQFLSSSIVDLQSELSSTDSDYEFIVRDLEVEVSLLVESREVLRNNKKERTLVYILPTTTQLKEINPEVMNRLKFSLAVVAKE